MSEPVIQVEGLAKRYRLGGAVAAESFRELLARPFAKLRSRAASARASTDFWALRDVSFTVEQGQCVGIIGSNGAGKSTLLKVLSRITDPSAGRALVRGRVGSLLEVGTGFHPELSGRENIFLNGAVLGMRRREIQRKFDAIVDFSGIEKFLDTPVKRYSSGMYVRLAFAVAAHLEPEILVVDEVLAVGDAAFQKKCMGKMSDVARAGRTVLFVSHNLSAMRALCNRGLLLEQGTLAATGPIGDVVDQYLARTMERSASPVADRADRRGDGSARITSVRIENLDRSAPIASGSRLQVTIDYHGDQPLQRPRFLLGIYDMGNTGLYLLDSDSADLPESLPATGSLVCRTDPINLTPGHCYVNVALQKGGSMVDYVTHAAAFEVAVADDFGLRHIPGRDWVMCLLRQQWHVGQRLAA